MASVCAENGIPSTDTIPHVSSGMSLKYADSSRVFPVECGKEYDFKRPSYKSFTTTEDQSKFEAWMKQRFPHSNSSIHSSECQTNILKDHLDNPPPSIEASSSIQRDMSTSSFNNYPLFTDQDTPSLSSKMEIIRRQMMQRQTESPMRLKLYQSRLNKIINAVPTINPMQPPIGWKARYPEPVIKTPPRTASSTSQTKLSAPPYVSLGEMEDSFNKIPSPTGLFLHQRDSPGGIEVNKRQFRPQTAPPMIYNVDEMSSNQQQFRPSTEMIKRVKAKSIQTRPQSEQGVRRAASTNPVTGRTSIRMNHNQKSQLVLESTPLEKSALDEGMALQMGKSQEGFESCVEPTENKKIEQTTVCDSWTENNQGKFQSKTVADDLQDDYDRALKKYGWKMEIPGDPYNLKKQFIPPRKDISVTLKEPDVLPQAPMMLSVNKDTFFHCVMPQRVLSFEISPDFVSQHYNAHRENLRKQGKWKYADKNFSFIY